MFGSKYKEALFEAKIELAKLELQNAQYGREVARAETLADQALKGARELEKKVAELEKDKAVLMERLDLLANHLAPEPKAFSYPEEVEDAQWQLDKGVINQNQFESILEAAGALNTEIHFDAEDYPRLSAVK